MEELLKIVRTYHPLITQSSIRIEKAQAEVLLSKSNFDPILSNSTAKKTFDGKDYYDYSTPEIKIPTWFGMEISGGLENLSGSKYDPTETLGKTNYAGISIPLAKNLLMDKRRATLKQAKLFSSMAEVEKNALVNDILMQSIEAYWNWVKAYQTFLVVKKNTENSMNRFNLVKRSFFNGERPAIDTLEAYSQFQSFQLQENSKWLEFQNTGLNLSLYLWKNENQPYEIPTTVIPKDNWETEIDSALFNFDIKELTDRASKNHPNNLVYTFKLNALEIEKKLKFQELLPKIDFKYNLLGKGYDIGQTISNHNYFENNFQYGIKLEMPLLFMKGRSEYKLAKLKISENTIDQTLKRNQIDIKIKSYYNEYVTLKSQIGLQTNMYTNYQLLVKAEETRLLNGESSLFLVNSRENKALEALEKLIDLKTKYFKTIYAIRWSAGELK
jgi:outer membrane protein TolC